MEYARGTILCIIFISLITRVIIIPFILLALKYYDEEYTSKDIFFVLLFPFKALFDYFIVGKFPYEHNPEEQIKIWERKIKDYKSKIKILEKEIEETKRQLKKEN